MVNSICLHLQFRTDYVYNGEWIQMRVPKENIPHMNAKVKLHSVWLISVVGQNRYFNRQNPTECEVRMFGETFRFKCQREYAPQLAGDMTPSVWFANCEYVRLNEVVDMYIGRIQTYEDFTVDIRFLSSHRIPLLFNAAENLPLAFSMFTTSLSPADSIRTFYYGASIISSTMPIIEAPSTTFPLDNPDEPLIIVKSVGRNFGDSGYSSYTYYGSYNGETKLIGRIASSVNAGFNTSIVSVSLQGSISTNEVIKVTGLPINGVLESGITRTTYGSVGTIFLWEQIGVTASTQDVLGGLDTATRFYSASSGGAFGFVVANLYAKSSVVRYIRFAYVRDAVSKSGSTTTLQVFLLFEGVNYEVYPYTFASNQLSDLETVYVEIDLHVFSTYTGGATLIGVGICPHHNISGAFWTAFSPVLLYDAGEEFVMKTAYPNDVSIRLEMGK